MKFYYKDQLMRTSKNHDYKYAIIEEKNSKIVCQMCSKTYDGCEKGKNKMIAEIKKYIRWDQQLLAETDNEQHAKEWQEEIEMLMKRLEEVKANWIIVELEKR